jgi:hypothetical protein
LGQMQYIWGKKITTEIKNKYKSIYKMIG